MNASGPGQASFFGFPLNLKNIGAENTAVNQSRTLGEHLEVWSVCGRDFPVAQGCSS